MNYCDANNAKLEKDLHATFLKHHITCESPRSQRAVLSFARYYVKRAEAAVKKKNPGFKDSYAAAISMLGIHLHQRLDHQVYNDAALVYYLTQDPAKRLQAIEADKVDISMLVAAKNSKPGSIGSHQSAQ